MFETDIYNFSTVNCLVKQDAYLPTDLYAPTCALIYVHMSTHHSTKEHLYLHMKSAKRPVHVTQITRSFVGHVDYTLDSTVHTYAYICYTIYV